MAIDKGRMGGGRGLHKCLAAGVAERVQANGYQFKTVVGRFIEFVSQGLPHGQVSRAASVGRPGVDNDFLAAQAGQIEGLAFDIRQAKGRRGCLSERSRADRFWAQCP